ncbi:dihydroxy-acid dehydratase [Diplocloster modestus]|uniref:Dihydroxy-acid dehydratase n=1 Tax=Diplocloster modestus TaxID=2850322 RepID=A0ABS6KBA9_9FIRM|nr:dihydroxy-acid dehydratase [Diplocloster modestus]MBU9727793.1 dihydroxy-acid dehydratase [Diplocloster modestus]
MRNNDSTVWKKRGSRQALLRNALLKSMGYTQEDIDRPIVGILNTWAETNPGHVHFRQLSEAVKRGVWAAGGFPLEMNTMSICEVFFDVSSLIYRNLLSMTTEELICRQPFDGVVLIGGCDKNVPAQLMAAVSANKPTIFLPGGAMLPGKFKGETLACGTDSFVLWNKYTSGEMTLSEVSNYEGCLYGSAGACPIMGTANTCQTLTEALGIALPHSASCLAVSSEKLRISEQTGRQIVKLIEKDVRCLDIITKDSIENAIRVLMAVGGSTNLIIHLKAIARRAGIPLDLMEFECISRETPVLVNIKPHGTNTVGLGFHDAGGVQALMKELQERLHLDGMTVTGHTVGENLEKADDPYLPDVIRPLDQPVIERGGIAVLKGNLAPDGAVIKRSAASSHLLKHRGEARVFDSLEECEAYLLDDDSDMDENKVIILRGYGPKGAPGMPEFGNYLPIPPKLSRIGIRDYVRITDARMSGGAFGTVVLHVAPEAALGGPLAAVEDGDMIVLDVDRNRLELEVPDHVLQQRLQKISQKQHPDIERGFLRNFIDHVLQANEGCDMDYM